LKIKLTSWNVNGIRAVLKKGFMDFFNENQSDILCIQETKAHPDQVEILLKGYNDYWNSAEKKGYSGTAVFSKTKPFEVSNGIGIEKHDNEGRVITADYEHFYLVNCYTPNSKRDLSRLDYRHNEWEVDFLKYLKHLETRKPVILCGDLNVAHTENDLANPQTNKATKSRLGNAGFTNEERQSFENLINAGFIDTFRDFNEGNGHYSWWSYMAQARSRNIGWRIDYFCISSQLKPNLKSATILPNVMGSDHCPVEIELEF
jgi:exodeoxyribonuclease III